MKRQVTSIRGSYRQDSAFISWEDIPEGIDVPLTIKDVVKTTIKGQTDVATEALVFEERPNKFYHLNKERKLQIVAKTKKRNYEDWIGEKISLFRSKTKLYGKIVNCVHVRTK